MASPLVRRFLILGAPGSGKSTIASRIVQNYGFPHIAVGDLLRQQIQQRADDSRTIKEHIDKGVLVPDDIVLKLLTEEIGKFAEKGFLLEGYPRTLNQAENLYRQMRLSHVLGLNVPREELFQRLKYRWVHLPSGRIYNSQWKKPKQEGKDDETNEPLAQREDDRGTVLQYRLETYDKKINPVIEFYRKIGIFKEFSGRDSDQLWTEVKNHLDRVLNSSSSV